MKKLLFIANYGNKYGGAATSLLHLISDIKNNYYIKVMMPEDGELYELLNEIGVKTEISKFRIRYIFELAYKIYKGKYDLIYANSFHYRPILILIISKLLNIPFIWHIRELLNFKRDPQTRWIRFANLIIANSNATANSVSDIIEKEKIKVIKNGIKIDQFIHSSKKRIKIREHLNIPIDSTVICNIGRIGKQKNQLELISVASQLKNHISNLHFIFIGQYLDKEYLELMIQEVSNLDLHSKIHFVGHKSNIADYLCASDIMVHTSRAESQGRVILEAMASGTPVIAYDVGGIHESLIDRETGILVPFGRKDLLLDELKIMIHDDKKRKFYSGKGLIHVQNFSSQNTSNQIVRVIENLIR